MTSTTRSSFGKNAVRIEECRFSILYMICETEMSKYFSLVATSKLIVRIGRESIPNIYYTYRSQFWELSTFEHLERHPYLHWHWLRLMKYSCNEKDNQPIVGLHAHLLHKNRIQSLFVRKKKKNWSIKSQIVMVSITERDLWNSLMNPRNSRIHGERKGHHWNLSIIINDSGAYLLNFQLLESWDLYFFSPKWTLILILEAREAHLEELLNIKV